MNGRSVLDLCVMSEESVVDGVLIWRPLLPHDKSEIWKFAYEFNVPNFLDTTPRWSTRGKLRNETFPHLGTQYGNFKANLSLIGSSSMEWAAVIDKMLLQPFYRERVQLLPLGTFVDCSQHWEMPKAFWREVLRHTYFKMGFHTPPSQKSLQLIMNVCFSRGARTRPQWLNLRRNSATHYEPFRMLIFHPQFIHPASQPLAISDQLTSPSLENPTQYVTPDQRWTITLTRLPGSAGSPNPALQDKVSEAQLLSGSFSYCLPDSPPFAIGGKCRPLALMNKMIKAHVPLVCIAKGARGSWDSIQVHIRFSAALSPISQFELDEVAEDQ